MARSLPLTRLITSLPRYALPSVSIAPDAGESVSGAGYGSVVVSCVLPPGNVCVAPSPSTTAIGLSEETVRRLCPSASKTRIFRTVVCESTVPG